MIFPIKSSRLALAALALCAANPAHAQWTTHSLSVPRSAVGVVTVGDKVIIAGGLRDGLSTDVVDIYDDSTGSWSTSTLPSTAWALTGVSIGPYALFVGGNWFSDVVYVYNTETDQWSTTPLSVGRNHIAAIRLGSKAFFGGGESIGAGLAAIDVYDSELGPPSDPAAWSTSDLLHQRASPAGFAVDGRAVVAGGENALANSPWIEVFDGNATSLYETQLSTGFLPLEGTGVGSLAVMATYGLGTARFETFDVHTGAETIGPELPLTVALAATTLGERALFVGSNSQLNTVDAVHIFDSVTRLWSTSDLPTPDRALSVSTVGTKAIFAGGFVGLNVLIYDDRIGSSYCSPAAPNSTGAPALISAQGAPAVAADGSTRLNVTGMPTGSVGYVLSSRTQGLSMPAQSQGAFCLAGNIARFSRADLLLGGPADSVAFDHAAIPGLTQTAIQPGETWNYQCWYRDANPTPTSNFTDSVSVLYQ